MDSFSSIVTYVVTGLLGGLVILVRMVFTNQKQIELLKQEIKHRNLVLEELRTEQKELRRDLQRFLER